MSVEYEWVDGALTIQRATGIVLYVRRHFDPKQIPGDVNWSCAIEINKDQYEPKILMGKPGPKGSEIKRLAEYLNSLGYSGEWSRYHNGKKPKTVKV